MIRDDLSDRLVHLTRGSSYADASATLSKILEERQLLGGNGMIRGGYRCVCFSEAPIAKLGTILAEPGAHGVRYMPYGVMVSKQWLFDRGGRPVIYQPSADFNLLPEDLRYRHVRYEPPETDFSWEREWRIQTDGLKLDPDETTVVVPTRDWVEDVKNRFVGQAQRFASGTGTLPRSVARVPWHFIALEDLGVPIPTDQHG